jgi:hypothetical protein
MKLTSYSVVIGLALQIISCTTDVFLNPLKAANCINVTMTPSAAQAVADGGTASFSCTATGGDSSSYTYDWEFGDSASPSSSTDQNPGTVTFYAPAGPNTVTVTVSDNLGNTGTATVNIDVVQIQTPYPTDTQNIWYLGGVSSDGSFQTTATFYAVGDADNIPLKWDSTVGNATAVGSSDTLSATLTSSAPSVSPNDSNIALFDSNNNNLDSTTFSIYAPAYGYADSYDDSATSIIYVPFTTIIYQQLMETIIVEQVGDNLGNTGTMGGMHANESFPNQPVITDSDANWPTAGATGPSPIDSDGQFGDYYGVYGGFLSPTVVPSHGAGYATEIFTEEQDYFGGSSSAGVGQQFDSHDLSIRRGQVRQESSD